MSKPIPSISDLYASISADFKSKFGIQSQQDLRRVLDAVAQVEAGTQKLLYTFLAEVQKNLYPDRSDSETVGGTLERIGRIKIGRDPLPATGGEYTIEVTGSVGGVIDAGKQFKSTDDSENPRKLYEVKNTVTLAGSTGLVEIRALELGTESLLSVGDELSLTVSLPNVDR